MLLTVEIYIHKINKCFSFFVLLITLNYTSVFGLGVCEGRLDFFLTAGKILRTFDACKWLVD